MILEFENGCFYLLLCGRFCSVLLSVPSLFFYILFAWCVNFFDIAKPSGGPVGSAVQSGQNCHRQPTIAEASPQSQPRRTTKDSDVVSLSLYRPMFAAIAQTCGYRIMECGVQSAF